MTIRTSHKRQTVEVRLSPREEVSRMSELDGGTRIEFKLKDPKGTKFLALAITGEYSLEVRNSYPDRSSLRLVKG